MTRPILFRPHPIPRRPAAAARHPGERGEVEERDSVGLRAVGVRHRIDRPAGRMPFARLSRVRRDRLLRRARRA